MAYVEVDEPIVLDSTGQDIKDSLNDIKSAVQGLGTALGADKANISGDNIANPSAFRTNLGFKSTILSGTTGNSLYNGFYYGDINVSFSTTKIQSLTITTTTDNRPAFVQILSDTKLRVWTTVASTSASVKVNYYD